MPRARSTKRVEQSFSHPYHSSPYAVPSYSQNPQRELPQRSQQNNRSVNPSQPECAEAVKKTRNVACWTFQHGTDPPRWYFSAQGWWNQRRVERGLPEDKIPRIFRGFTVSEMNRRSESAHMEPAQDSVYCNDCGGLVIVQERHEASRLHQSRVRLQFSKEPFDALVEDMLLNPGVLHDSDDADS